MTLPKIDQPVFNIFLESYNKNFSFRPYTIKEEKLYLMLQKEESMEQEIELIKQLANNCCVSVDKPNFDTLPLFELEYIFICLRAKSISEIVNLVYHEDNKEYDFKVNLNNVKIIKTEGHTNKIEIIKDLWIEVNYPNSTVFKLFEKYAKNENLEEGALQLFISSIKKMYDLENVYSDFSNEEISNFINDLPVSSLDKIRQFYETMPKVQYSTQITKENGDKIDIVLTGLKDFFIY